MQSAGRLFMQTCVFASGGVFIGCLQVIEEVFSIQKHVFQCTHYHSVNLVIWLSFLSVVLHKEDAVQWKAQLLVESFNLSQSNNMLISNRTAMNKQDIYAEKWHCAKTPKCTFFFRYLLLWILLMSFSTSGQALSTLVRTTSWGIPVDVETWSVFEIVSWYLDSYKRRENIVVHSPSSLAAILTSFIFFTISSLNRDTVSTGTTDTRMWTLSPKVGSEL